MEARDVVTIYRLLARRGIRIWLDGGWGVDALLEEQTRYHKDLDIIVRDKDVAALKEVLAQQGFMVAQGTATSFVLTGPKAKTIDVHVVRFDDHGNGIYRMQNGKDWIYPAEGFAGKGKVLDTSVRCISAAAQMICHTGYTITRKDIREMELLHKRFGVDYPEEHAHLQHSRVLQSRDIGGPCMKQFTLNIGHDITLGLVAPEDAQDIFSLTDACRGYLRKWLPWVDGTRTTADTMAFIRSAVKQHGENKGFHCTIRCKGQLAGIIGYSRIDKTDRKTELGYWLGEQFQGQGIITRCCRALADYAFLEMDLNRVEILVAVENVKSCAIPRRLGFVHEGTLREAEWVNDRFLDLMVFAMLRRDWPKVHNR